MILGDNIIFGAIRGWAVGGGFEWAINSDLSVWGDTARAFFPEVRWGMFVTAPTPSLNRLSPAILAFSDSYRRPL